MLIQEVDRQHGLPGKATIDKSGADTTAFPALQKETGTESNFAKARCGGAGSARRERDCPAHARVQSLPLGPDNAVGHRTDAHDRKSQMLTVGGLGLYAAEQFYYRASLHFLALMYLILKKVPPPRFEYITGSRRRA